MRLNLKNNTLFYKIFYRRVLDTGDNYVITFKDDSVDIVVKLYEIMDISDTGASTRMNIPEKYLIAKKIIKYL